MKIRKIKGCKSHAPVHEDQRCELERGHDANPRSLHKAGFLVWNNEGEHRHHRTLSELIAGLTPWQEEILGDPHRRGKMGAEPTFVALDEAKAFAEPVTQISNAEHELRGWWFDLAEEEVDRTVPKAVEYSATDLADIGHQLARTAGRTVSDEEAAELGIFFYLQGKLSRWAGAIAHGKRPSDDTIFDIGVYCRMAQRVRHSGGWPGIDEEDNA